MKAGPHPVLANIKNLNNPLLDGLSDEQIEQIVHIMQLVQVEKGEMIIKEGEISDEVFIIQEGELDVIKQETESGEYFHLATLGAGESVGEVSLLDNEPRSASVVAAMDATLIRIGMEDLNGISSASDSASSRIKVNFAREMGQRLRKTNETTVISLHNRLEEAHARVAMGTVICWLLVGICFYVLALQWVTTLSNEVASTTVISVTILFVFGAMTLAAAKRSGYPLSFYGLSFKNWYKIAGEAFVFSIPLIALIALVKWLLIIFHPKMTGAAMLDWSGSLQVTPWELLGDIILYSVFTPVQEFIARGGVQSSFQFFLTNKHKNLYAILIANLMFSLTHVHLSPVFAMMVFLPGLFWGWLYYRQKSLVGVCVSHILIGLVAYYVIGFQNLL